MSASPNALSRFAACAADSACNAAYPNIEQVLFDLVEQLYRTPARVPLIDPETKKSYNAVIDGETLQGIIFQMLYATEIIPVLPHAIYAMRAGNFTLVSQIYPHFLFDHTISSGMYR